MKRATPAASYQSGTLALAGRRKRSAVFYVSCGALSTPTQRDASAWSSCGFGLSSSESASLCLVQFVLVCFLLTSRRLKQKKSAQPDFRPDFKSDFWVLPGGFRRWIRGGLRLGGFLVVPCGLGWGGGMGCKLRHTQPKKEKKRLRTTTLNGEPGADHSEPSTTAHFESAGKYAMETPAID